MGGQVDFRMSNVEEKKNFKIEHSLFKIQHSYIIFQMSLKNITSRQVM